MKLIYYFIVLFSFVSYSQKDYKSIHFSDSGAVLNPEYLKQLDEVFKAKRVIGLGESTHGTSEFTQIRLDLFKYLVQNHQYTIFFLEADYNACSRVNRYIHGADDNGKEALIEVRLWPWLTQEMLDIVEWMRFYNLENQNVLSFVGCDEQLISDDILELPRYFAMDTKFEICISKLPSLDFNKKDSTLVQQKKIEWQAFERYFHQAFPEEEKLLINTVTQWFEAQTSTGNTGNFRDSCMAINILNYLESRPNAKAIYFAHNGHVGKIAVQYHSKMPYFKRAGAYLDEKIKDQYFSLALDFNVGSFNAINYVDDKFEMEFFNFDRKEKKLLAQRVMGKDNLVKYIAVDSIPNKKMIITSIGAVYGRGKEGQKFYRFRTFERHVHDAYIIINRGTPTHLLTMTSRANKP